MKDKKFLVSLQDLEDAFCEWDRRFSEDKNQFDHDMELLRNIAPKRYGLVCALYLMKLVEENGKQEANDHHLDG